MNRYRWNVEIVIMRRSSAAATLSGAGRRRTRRGARQGGGAGEAGGGGGGGGGVATGGRRGREMEERGEGLDVDPIVTVECTNLKHWKMGGVLSYRKIDRQFDA